MKIHSTRGFDETSLKYIQKVADERKNTSAQMASKVEGRAYLVTAPEKKNGINAMFDAIAKKLSRLMSNLAALGQDTSQFRPHSYKCGSASSGKYKK